MSHENSEQGRKLGGKGSKSSLQEWYSDVSKTRYSTDGSIEDIKPPPVEPFKTQTEKQSTMFKEIKRPVFDNTFMDEIHELSRPVSSMLNRGRSSVVNVYPKSHGSKKIRGISNTIFSDYNMLSDNAESNKAKEKKKTAQIGNLKKIDEISNKKPNAEHKNIQQNIKKDKEVIKESVKRIDDIIKKSEDKRKLENDIKDQLKEENKDLLAKKKSMPVGSKADEKFKEPIKSLPEKKYSLPEKRYSIPEKKDIIVQKEPAKIENLKKEPEVIKKETKNDSELSKSEEKPKIIYDIKEIESVEKETKINELATVIDIEPALEIIEEKLIPKELTPKTSLHFTQEFEKKPSLPSIPRYSLEHTSNIQNKQHLFQDNSDIRELHLNEQPIVDEIVTRIEPVREAPIKQIIHDVGVNMNDSIVASAPPPVKPIREAPIKQNMNDSGIKMKDSKTANRPKQPQKTNTNQIKKTEKKGCCSCCCFISVFFSILFVSLIAAAVVFYLVGIEELLEQSNMRNNTMSNGTHLGNMTSIL